MNKDIIDDIKEILIVIGLSIGWGIIICAPVAVPKIIEFIKNIF